MAIKTIENKTFDMERALYGQENLTAVKCIFDGSQDGESAFKECCEIEADDCFFNLRYPFWHDYSVKIRRCEMTENCRAALWYSKRIEITDTKLHGIKALRECSDVKIENCEIISPEFGWSSEHVQMRHTAVQSEYFMLHSKALNFYDVSLKGKYSFQYIDGAVFENCFFDTKDAFWHSRHVTVKNSTLRGEYLAWYSEGLTLINCKIIGTQPLCWCKDLTLIDCEMEETDLCFEKSDVRACVKTPVVSIKNPLSGWILAPSVGELIIDDARYCAEVITGEIKAEAFCKRLLENKAAAEAFIKKELPQLKVLETVKAGFIKLDGTGVTGSMREATQMPGEEKWIRPVKEVGAEEIFYADTSCSAESLNERLYCLRDSLKEYEEFCMKRC